MNCACCGCRDGLTSGSCVYCDARTSCSCGQILACGSGRASSSHACPHVMIVGTVELVPTVEGTGS